MSAKQAHYTADPLFIEYKKENDVNGFDIKPKGLNIIWGKDSRYWKFLENDEVELIQVSWLEVSGKVRVNPGKMYRVQFNMKVKENAFGWHGTKVLVMAKLGRGGKYIPKPVFLKPGYEVTIPSEHLEISVPPEARDLDLYFGLYEVWSGKWKGGLVIKSVDIIEL